MFSVLVILSSSIPASEPGGEGSGSPKTPMVSSASDALSASLGTSSASAASSGSSSSSPCRSSGMSNRNVESSKAAPGMRSSAWSGSSCVRSAWSLAIRRRKSSVSSLFSCERPKDRASYGTYPWRSVWKMESSISPKLGDPLRPRGPSKPDWINSPGIARAPSLNRLRSCIYGSVNARLPASTDRDVKSSSRTDISGGNSMLSSISTGSDNLGLDLSKSLESSSSYSSISPCSCTGSSSSTGCTFFARTTELFSLKPPSCIPHANHIPRLKFLSTSRGESLCCLPLLLLSLLGVNAACRRCSSARIACGVDGALLFAGTGRGYLPTAVVPYRRCVVVVLPLTLESDAAPVLGARLRRALGVVDEGVRRMEVASLRSYDYSIRMHTFD